MPKQYRLSIRGSQKEEIDEDLFAEALLMIAEDLSAQHDDQDDDDQPTKCEGDEQ